MIIHNIYNPLKVFAKGVTIKGEYDTDRVLIVTETVPEKKTVDKSTLKTIAKAMGNERVELNHKTMYLAPWFDSAKHTSKDDKGNKLYYLTYLSEKPMERRAVTVKVAL